MLELILVGVCPSRHKNLFSFLFIYSSHHLEIRIEIKTFIG